MSIVVDGVVQGMGEIITEVLTSDSVTSVPDTVELNLAIGGKHL